MAQGSFGATVSAWVAEKKTRMVAVRNESVQRTIEIAQTPRGKGGNLRVDTGFLRASLMFAAGDANFTLRENPKPDAPKGSLDSYNPGQLTLILAGTPLGKPIVAVWTANYARPREYGARGQAGDRWVGLAAQQWLRIVDEVSREAQARNS